MSMLNIESAEREKSEPKPFNGFVTWNAALKS